MTGPPKIERGSKLPDWDAPRRPTVTAAEAIYLLALGLLILVFLFLLGLTVRDEGTGITLVLFFIFGLGISLGTSGRRALLSAQARRLKEHEHPRLANLVGGLAKDLGVPAPKLRIIEDEGANAMVCRSGGPVIAVTDELMTTFTRTEIEAVVAHCLVRLNSRGLRMAMLASELVFLAGPLRPMVGFDDDIRAVAVTKYPPGMIAAIRKAASRSGRHQPLWFVADGRWHNPREQRTAAIEDL
ncbi:MAG: M48 family metalloprotease [Actinobacteria bacterium]|nr:M48 family metalloprotease [Actinomycetota bacterium]